VARLALVPSPFVGADTWRPTAALLPDALAIDYGGVSGPDWYEGVGRRVAAAADGRPWVAVLHSGAGGFAPAIAAAARDLVGLVYIDAVTPYPGLSCLENAPADLAARLVALCGEDHRLPPWNLWFDEDPAPRLIRDATARRAFLDNLPRTPFAFLEAVCPPHPGWERLPSVYIKLSKAYDETAAQAERRGWPVRQARLNHLAMITNADEVAALLADLPAMAPAA
jgi:hypothetical protein